MGRTDPSNAVTRSRGRRGRWIALSLVGVAAGLVWLLQSTRGPSAVDRWMEARRHQGERFTLAELGLAERSAFASPVFGAIEAAQSALTGFYAPGEGVGSSVKLPARPQAVLWQAPRLESVTLVTADWGVMQTRLAAVEPALAAVRTALGHPTTDPGGPYTYTAIPRANYVALRETAQVLADAVVVELQRGASDRALADLVALIRLAGQHSEWHWLVSQMIRVALAGLAIDCTWQALQWPGWSDADLELIQTELERLSLLPELVVCLEVERAMGIEFHRQMVGKPSGGAPTGTGGLVEGLHLRLWRSLGSRRDLLAYLQAYQARIEALRAARDGTAWTTIAARVEAVRTDEQRRAGRWFGYRFPLAILSSLAFPNLDRAMATAVRTESRRRLAVVSVALERFRLRHGQYPERLDDLESGFLTDLPTDPYSAGPLNYHRLNQGPPRLWSVGANGRDDGGRSAPDQDPDLIQEATSEVGPLDEVWAR